MTETQLIGDILNENEDVETEQDTGKLSVLDQVKKEELARFRSSSAPPRSEEHLPFDQDADQLDFRYDPDYYAYYQENRLLNPRLPPPIVTPHWGHILRSKFSRLTETTQLVQPTTQQQETTEKEVEKKVETSWVDVATSNTKKTSLVDKIQQDFPTTPSSVYKKKTNTKNVQSNNSLLQLAQQNQIKLQQQQQKQNQKTKSNNTKSSQKNKQKTNITQPTITINQPRPQKQRVNQPVVVQQPTQPSTTIQQRKPQVRRVVQQPILPPRGVIPTPMFFPDSSTDLSRGIQQMSLQENHDDYSQQIKPSSYSQQTLVLNHQVNDHMQYYNPYPQYVSPQVYPPQFGVVGTTPIGQPIGNHILVGQPRKVFYNQPIIQQPNITQQQQYSDDISNQYQSGNGPSWVIDNQQSSYIQKREPRKKQRNVDSYQDYYAPTSKLMEEFKSGKGRKFDLRDIVGHVVEFSRDQHGSRFIQQKLENASNHDKEMVFAEVYPEALNLMTDVFGNYVIQKFFEHGLKSQQKALCKVLKGHVLALTLQTYGCRVIQKALEVMDEDDMLMVSEELSGHVMKCVQDQNGNHVIQKCIEKIPPKITQFIVDAFVGNVVAQATHAYGCRVIQRILEHCNENQCKQILDEILLGCTRLVKDPYGNYVVQHVLEHGRTKHKSEIIKNLKGSFAQLSTHKFASNVVEKCYKNANKKERQEMIDELLGKGISSRDLKSTPMFAMMKDGYANYVVQKIIEFSDEAQRKQLIDVIKPHVATVRRTTYGKHIIACIEKFEKL